MYSALEGTLHSGTLPDLGGWDYLLLALLSALQGPAASLVGGTAAAAGIVRLGGVFASISAGNLIFDVLWYGVGRAGKIDWLMGSNRLFKAPRERVEKLRTVVADQSSTVMTLAKLTSGFVMPTMIATGLARVPWKRWLPSLVAIEVLRTGALTLLGYYSARSLSQFLQGYSYVTWIGTLVLVLVSGFVIFRTLRLDDRLEQTVSK